MHKLHTSSDNVTINENNKSEGYSVTYDVENDEFASVYINGYINSSDLFELSKFVTEFEEIIKNQSDDIILAVANIIPHDDKPIKIRRIKINEN